MYNVQGCYRLFRVLCERQASPCVRVWHIRFLDEQRSKVPRRTPAAAALYSMYNVDVRHAFDASAHTNQHSRGSPSPPPPRPQYVPSCYSTTHHVSPPRPQRQPQPQSTSLVPKQVTRQNLQLVGVTAMLLASKYEEIYPPQIRDLVFITDRAYNREQILSMESTMANALQFRLTVPTTYCFLLRYLKVNNPIEISRQETCILYHTRYIVRSETVIIPVYNERYLT